MNKKVVGATLVALPLVIGSFAVLANPATQPADPQTQSAQPGFVCPITGENLPCPKCCQLNQAAE